MAQTIAMQRGATSITASGGYNTLWTQSSGVATRVIPNMLVGYWTQSPLNVASYVTLTLQSSTGGSQVLGWMYISSSATQYRTWQAGINYNATNQMAPVSTSSAMNGWNLYTNGSGYIADNVANITYNLQILNVNSGFTPLGQFYMGNGDSLKIRSSSIYQSGKSQFNNTLQVAWSFTTVTES